MSAFGRFCWKSRRWKSVKFYTCFDASVLERREGPHSPRPTYSMTLYIGIAARLQHRGALLSRAAQFPRWAEIGLFQQNRPLYQVPEGVTRPGFPNRRGSDSTWRTKEVRHVSSYTPAWGFWGGTFARPGEEDKGRSAGPTATGPGGDLRRCDPHRGGEDRWGWSPDHPGLGLAGLCAGPGRIAGHQAARSALQAQ